MTFLLYRTQKWNTPHDNASSHLSRHLTLSSGDWHRVSTRSGRRAASVHNHQSGNAGRARRCSMITVVFGTVLPWLLIAIGTWLAYELVRQNGRILSRLE